MASKIARFIPLAISGAVFIGFLLNFMEFRLDLGVHFRYGAGLIFGEDGIVNPPDFFANLYLHISLLALFIGGIFFFAAQTKMSGRGSISVSIVMLLVFLLRPVITLINAYFVYGDRFPFFGFIPTLQGQLLFYPNDIGNLDSFLIKSYITGLILLLLLVLNVIFSFRHKQDPAFAERKQQQRDFLNQQAQARQSAWSAQQQMQAQALRQMPIPVQPQGASVSMTQELERLQQMYQSGVLTEAEFIAAKQRIIGG
jgi:hypothetical protein